MAIKSRRTVILRKMAPARNPQEATKKIEDKMTRRRKKRIGLLQLKGPKKTIS
jgi:hypothetical protein